jgi:multidrug efflux pump subunit AcrB
MIFIFWLGLASLRSIPKESSPQIKFGIVQISTAYIGANPVDIDALITEKIEDAIDDLEGMKKYSSVSSNSFSSTTIELENDTDTDAFVNKVRTALANVSLPEATEDPNISELSVESDQMFNLLLYAPADLYDLSTLKDRAVQIKDILAGAPGVSKVTIQWSEDYEFRLLVDQTMATEYGLTPSSIAGIIRASQQNIPLWSYQIDDLNYDFRVQGQLADITELLELPLTTSAGVRLTLGQISRLIRQEKNDTEAFFGVQNLDNQRLVSLTVYKSAWMSIFAAADSAKETIREAMTDQVFSNIGYAYTQDLSEVIKQDYATLSSSALQTVILVFVTMLFFVGRKPSIIATIGLPMGFMITFIVLDTLGYTLNFLTNFSLVLTLGIAIDTTIVIIEAASEKMKLGYNPKTAALFAIKDFKNSIIAGTLTTIVVFIPMMTLPGVLGKFLAYIPITIFSTLLAILFLALTLNSALYYKLSKKQKTYLPNPSAEQFIPEEERAILAEERADKTIQTEKITRRQRVLDSMSDRYEHFLQTFVSKASRRRWSIFLPLLGVIGTFIFLAPHIGFTLFPSGDVGVFNITVSSIPGTTKERISELIPFIEPHLQGRPELKQYTITVRDNALDVAVDLTDKKDRQKANQRNVFEVEKDLLEDLQFIVQDGYTIASVVQAGGPPQGKPVGIKLVTNTSSQFSNMITFAKSIEQYLKTIEWTKNVAISSPDTPGQFILTFDIDKLAFVGLTQAQAASEVASAINGATAGTIKVNGEDRTIKVLYETFADVVTPESITDLTITTPRGENVRIGDLIEIQPDAAVAQISRENGKISVRVESELADGFTAQGAAIQSNLLAHVNSLPLPEWISIEAVGESEENAELIWATLRGFAISLALMFVILLLMFDSFTKPAIILYTIILALLWVNIGLFATWNPYSMPFMIWFIALAGIVVNDAIIFLDRIRENVSHDIDEFVAIVEAGKSRLQPILLTTITTVFGILPLALQDEFWAGLGFTIVFGLTAGSLMTLFVVPSLYYELIVIKKLTWVKVLFWTIVFFPVGIALFFKAVYMKIRRKKNKQEDAPQELTLNDITL